MNEQLRSKLAKTERKKDTVDVPGFGTLDIRSLTTRQFLTASQAMVGEDGKVDNALMPDMLLIVTAFGLGLELSDVEALDLHPGLVNKAGPAILELSDINLEEDLKND